MISKHYFSKNIEDPLSAQILLVIEPIFVNWRELCRKTTVLEKNVLFFNHWLLHVLSLRGLVLKANAKTAFKT